MHSTVVKFLWSRAEARRMRFKLDAHALLFHRSQHHAKRAHLLHPPACSLRWQRLRMLGMLPSRRWWRHWAARACMWRRQRRPCAKLFRCGKGAEICRWLRWLHSYAL